MTKEEKINKEIIHEFASAHVLGNITPLVESSIRAKEGYISIQDIDNFFDDCTDEINELEELDYNSLTSKKKEEIDARLMELYGREELGRDIEEWFLVTKPFAEELYQRGETCIILPEDELYIWGREELEDIDPVSEDKVLLDICTDLRILCGMKYSWEKKL